VLPLLRPLPTAVDSIAQCNFLDEDENWGREPRRQTAFIYLSVSCGDAWCSPRL